MKNVILLTIDTLRKDVLGCYGNRSELSPFIDSIQNRCIRFTKAHSPGPYTQAAFPGILTSSYYLEYGRQKMLSEKRVLISEVLRKAGIATAGFHSNPYLSEYFGWNRGWDVFYDSMEDEVDDRVPYIKAGEINGLVLTSTFAVNTPMVQQIFSILILKEKFRKRFIIAVILIIGGNYIILFL